MQLHTHLSQINWLSVSDVENPHVYDSSPKVVLQDDAKGPGLMYGPEGAWNTYPDRVSEFSESSGQ